MTDQNRITNWLKQDDLEWLAKEKKRLDAEPSSDFRCHIEEVRKKAYGSDFALYYALFYDKIYFVDGTMYRLPI